MGTLHRGDTTLVVVDVQEGFRKAIGDFDAVAGKVRTLVEGARVLGVPTIATEQYPKGLGATVPEAGLPDDVEPLEKTVFAASRADGFALTTGQAVVCGIEAHVCVHQTVADLRERGVDVHVAADAVASRDPANRDVALERAREAGALVTTVEMALLELCGRAGTDEFKAVQRLIR